MINRVKHPASQMATQWCLISMCEINEGLSFECSAVWDLNNDDSMQVMCLSN